jgi:hypothetical protein
MGVSSDQIGSAPGVKSEHGKRNKRFSRLCLPKLATRAMVGYGMLLRACRLPIPTL